MLLLKTYCQGDCFSKTKIYKCGQIQFFFSATQKVTFLCNFIGEASTLNDLF